MEGYSRHPNTNCLVCKKPIYRRKSQMLLNKGHAFCSTKCYGKYNSKEHPCIICNQPILAKYNKKTCSRSCANINRAGIKYKKVGVFSKNKVETLRALKLRLLKKRGSTCERCEYNKIEILQVHHVDRNKSNNDLENLALICPNCHFEDHFLEKSWLKGYNSQEIMVG